MNDKQQDDVLIDAYRRASASDADRPSAATRAAILAEAAAAARRNAPAANESRYWLRAVAGIAVLGIGVLLWRQTDYRTPGEAPVVDRVPETQTLESVAKAERAPSPATAPKAERAAVEERGADSVGTDTVAVNDQPSPQPFPASPASPPPSPPRVVESNPPQLARNTADEELEETTITGTRIQMPNNERIDAAFAAPNAPPPVGGPPLLDSTTLLLRYFPAQYQSDAAHSVWLVLSAAGDVLQSGELTRGQRLADLAPQLGRALGDRVPGPWQVQVLRNARGQPIELAIARVP